MIKVIFCFIIAAIIGSSISAGNIGAVITVVLFIAMLFGSDYIKYALRVRSTNKARPAGRQYPTISLGRFIIETIKYRFNRIVRRTV